ncbi:ATP-binding protein [Sphingomonas sp. CROZ-RG-20F-R02-07]|uniref:sensor histidine kinase n=1 Tax=Sphingomonas sp. CROZ-RG-20F-R02-07 TaxID=2914832 RepID=UPI001F565A74|nr:ATP-binding protein [Sphingomonas sp. CROZ-RG-20F-R02-07]
MIADATPYIDDGEQPARFSITPALELIVLGVAGAIAVASYFVVRGELASSTPLTPAVVASLLVANMVPGIALLVLIGRRVARRKAAKSPVGGNGQLHVRLVVLFSSVAAIPMILVAIIASLLFQYGVEFWFSDRARGMLENAQSLAKASYSELLRYVDNENVAMANDVSRMLLEKHWMPDSQQFIALFGQDVFQRSLSGAVLFSITPSGEIHTEALVKNSDRSPVQDIDAREMRTILQGAPSVAGTDSLRTHSITRVLGTPLFLYATREGGAKVMAERMERARAVFTDYRTLLYRSRAIQLRFNIALLALSLFVVAIVVFVALTVADRLVRPVNELVDAARRVEGGDLTARVPDPRTRDEVGTLAKAFNQMTGRLQEQNTALVTANDQLDSRRALIEAVMSGVSAGVIATTPDGIVRIANSSAAALLHAGDDGLAGQPLAARAPELGALIVEGAREAIVQVGEGAEARTLAVRIARTDAGPILTFDDITQQLLDQRRAAWSDVARRIAHEIKNPLTPIQLAAERLQRRYGAKIEGDDGTFTRLTDTIVRQVGDLRRMVDEFSSFARMPKPVFREESLVDAARQALFLHEVAHPGIRFALVHDDPGPNLVCDRRQIGQALTNIVKNAVEAIEAKGGDGGTVTMTLTEEPGHGIGIAVADSGVGLPAERDRIIEPYMTTRARGTGLGLAIVKKIIEEHHGTIQFSDRPGGGTVVTMMFDVAALAALDQGASTPELAGEGQLAALTRNRMMG